MWSKEEYCTVRQVAETTQVSTSTIRRLIAAGTLKAVRVGRSVRIDRRAVKRMLSKEGPAND